MREHQNFFKHAEKDHENSIDFNPDLTEYHIFDAILKYREMSGEQVIFFNIFQGWFSGHHMEMLIYPEDQKEFILNTMRMYGGNRLEFFSEMLQASTKLK